MPSIISSSIFIAAQVTEGILLGPCQAVTWYDIVLILSSFYLKQYSPNFRQQREKGRKCTPLLIFWRACVREPRQVDTSSRWNEQNFAIRRHHSHWHNLKLNDRATVLCKVYAQDEEVGDGTTTVTVLVAELLREPEAEKLIKQKLHPQTIVEGYRIAMEKAASENNGDFQKFRQNLFNIARATLSSKVLSQDKDYFANLALDVVLIWCSRVRSV